jgi:hypothetical protein
LRRFCATPRIVNLSVDQAPGVWGLFGPRAPVLISGGISLADRRVRRAFRLGRARLRWTIRSERFGDAEIVFASAKHDRRVELRWLAKLGMGGRGWA